MTEHVPPRAWMRAAVRLAAEHVRTGPPRDWGPGSTVHDAMADAVEEFLDRIDDPGILHRLIRIAEQEARR
jgi:hypothetical protein